MPLERYLDLHAALERGTGSVQSFSAVEAGMFRMADLKQASALPRDYVSTSVLSLAPRRPNVKPILGLST